MMNDSWIRKTISAGYEVELEVIPTQVSIQKPLNLLLEDQEKTYLEIERFLKCKIIEKVDEVNNSKLISKIFFHPKKDQQYN